MEVREGLGCRAAADPSPSLSAGALSPLRADPPCIIDRIKSVWSVPLRATSDIVEEGISSS